MGWEVHFVSNLLDTFCRTGEDEWKMKAYKLEFDLNAAENQPGSFGICATNPLFFVFRVNVKSKISDKIHSGALSIARIGHIIDMP
jgi:hypothetical protein